MTKKRRPETLLDLLKALENRPPQKANRTIARYLKCKKSQELCAMVTEAVDRSRRGVNRPLEAPSALLPPLA